MQRLRVGVVGCGLIAQVMHLPHLRDLRERFEVAALCDISRGTLDAVGDHYGVERRYTRWQDLLRQDLDAVLVLTAGSHAPPCIAALEAGRHVFVEKPLCWTLREADAMIAAAERAGRVLMVGNMKRFDPAYERARPLVAGLRDLRMVRVTTLEAPMQPYVSHYPLFRHADVDAGTLAALRAEGEALLREALGAAASPTVLRLYAEVLLDSLVHEINMLRGLLGEPEAVVSAEAWRDADGLTAVLRFPGDVRCVLSWIVLPELPHYTQELAFYGSAARVTLSLPSPFLRNEPTALLVESTQDGALAQTALTVSYEEAFLRELVHFHACVTEGRVPATPAGEARQDIVVLQAIARAAAEGGAQPIAAPR